MVTDHRKPYPSDVSVDEWAFVARYLTLMRDVAPQRQCDLREVFNALRWIVRAGAPWRMLPTNFPPWPAVDHQTQRWIAAGVFEAMVHDLRELLRWLQSRVDQPTAAILDSRTLQSTLESGGSASWDGAKRRKGSKVHLVVDTLGNLLALHVTTAQDRDHVGVLAEAIQAVTGESVTLADVDAGYTGERTATAAQAHEVELALIKLPDVKRGFVLLSRALGGRTGICLDQPVSTTGPRRRTIAPNRRRTALSGLGLPDAPSILHLRRPKSITRSS